ncbi:phosphoribosylformylglycinamidine synthase subunit PurS [bacterium]|jgi:phosphoribosylformylglycinamidine synthase|nr:phosphoribosylformylglycinamidine synthase subunit PurS [bacterium]MBT3849714.1 phosphoribosylformylglycinamidine synthase subunit PurS [bacterium]MBT4435841.1 phosphoribosylformylglycinamidine synthase subunit PurS [bacterium]MDG2446141.1 phosphoribosylformylglycinamidine synthase subunit PurS [Thermodesulfobacteriota bacterium]NSW99316.1 phosphoribosylformylglycinamidine synthase subunit PurS [bacterium]|tara:strand:- start:10718 stop:10978 length:261 start_codon:yes stop_codon:yes gene_type:complete
MKKFNITIEIMPVESVLDPQGEAVELIVKNNTDYKTENFRIGKRINFTISSTDKKECKKAVKKLCESFLVNEIIEKYSVTIQNEKN